MIAATLGNDDVVQELLVHSNYLLDLTAIDVRIDTATELSDSATRSIDYKDMEELLCYGPAMRANSIQRNCFWMQGHLLIWATTINGLL